jgi:pyridoxal phosphate enzyme (YggS family)
MAGRRVSVADRLALVRGRIAGAGADPDRVRIVAVTKGHPADRVEEAVHEGLLDIGESYAQELATKAELVDAGVRWHFVGGLQRNKVRQVAGFVHLWQSVDRLSLAAEIARHAPAASVLVQVNVSGREHQGGCAPERVAAVVEGCADLGLDVRGLMAIGPQGTDEEVRHAFRTVRELADRFKLPECSMGMSGDLEAAVAEGSTMVRIGTDLVGTRPDPRSGAGTVGK